MTTDINVRDFRKPEHEINHLLLKRWSPRALSGAALPGEELMSLFEAAKWAPSAYNNQPWRFIYARNNTPEWDKLFSLLVEFNQLWTKKAAALALLVSRQTFEHNGQPNPTASFDTGAAWENLAIEAANRGLVAHGMSGFDYARAKKEFNISDDYKVEAMIAIGLPGDKNDLPEEMRDNEKPSDRKMLSALVGEGKLLA